MAFLGLVLGIIIIIIGAEIFINGIEAMSINFKIPRMFIALTILAFGTSAPELAISFQGLLNNNGELVLSNVIGSTIVNTFLIIGVASLITPIKVKNKTVKEELPLHLLIILIFVFIFFDSAFNNMSVNIITRNDALLLLLIFSLFLRHLINMIKEHKKITHFVKTEKPKYGLKKSIIYSAIGLSLIIGGGKITVDLATSAALSLGVSEKVITMLFIVIGTSIPELIMSIISARKKQYDFIIGNIIGTNIFNICIVLGLPIALIGAVESISFHLIDMIVIGIAGLLLYLFAKNDRIISKKEGLIMILIFCGYYGYILL